RTTLIQIRPPNCWLPRAPAHAALRAVGSSYRKPRAADTAPPAQADPAAPTPTAPTPYPAPDNRPESGPSTNGRVPECSSDARSFAAASAPSTGPEDLAEHPD